MPRDSDLETSVERADPLVGTIFDRRFRIEERIATGGFGAIYRATHVKSSHPVALKVLLPSLAQDLGVVARFRREGDTLTALRNPHTITAYELGQAADRTLFITMELLHGESLYERYKAQGPLEWKRMVRIARQICESLEEAHAMGIVHRDLKPTNIHLETKGGDVDFVKVLDFGIAKIIGGALDATDLTNAGQMVGTLDYMSPEQMVGGTVTGQTDIYTLGIVMYEMIAGATPFPEAMTAAQALAAVMKLEPDPLYLRVPVPEELDRIVQKCLARETERRYQTVAELRADLDRLLAGGAVDRGASFETKPVARQDDEATMFTPPPEPVLAASRRAKRPSGEETTFTPPPEPLLAASRRAADWSNEATTAGTPSAQLLAASRRAKRPSVEETSFTPPPEQVLADLRRAPRPRQDADHEWTDDDEHAATVRRRREASDTEQQSGEQDKVTAVARLADIVERAARTRGPAHAGRDASERAATIPRDASERAATVPRGARGDDSPVEPATPPYPRQPGGPASRTADAAAVRKSPSAPPAARKPPSGPPRSAPTVDGRPHTQTAQPPSTLTPPRATSPHEDAPAVPRTLSPHQVPPGMSSPRSPPAMPRTLSPHQVPPEMSPRSPSSMPRTLSPHQVPPDMSSAPGMSSPPSMPRTLSPHQVPPDMSSPPGMSSPPSMPRTLSPHQVAPPDMSPPSMPRTLSPHQVPHDMSPPSMPRTLSPHQVPHDMSPPSMPRTLSPHHVAPPDMSPPPLPRTITPHQIAAPSLPRTVTPHHLAAPGMPSQPGARGLPVAAPFSSSASAAGPYPSASASHGMSPLPPSPYPSAYPSVSGTPHAGRGYDMGKMAAREATIRRLIWIAVLVLAVGVGVVLATQLG